MRFAASCALLLVGVAAPAAAQVSEPASRCVQNCGSAASGSSSTTTRTAPRRDASSEAARQAELATDEGELYYDRQDWANAVRSFEEALEYTPDDPYLQKFLKAAKARRDAKKLPVLGANGKVNPPTALPPPPLRRNGARKVPGGPVTVDGVVTSGKG